MQLAIAVIFLTSCTSSESSRRLESHQTFQAKLSQTKTKAMRFSRPGSVVGKLKVKAIESEP